MINLIQGKPADELLPHDRIACAFQAAMAADNATTSLFQYGHELGNESYLNRLAQFLTRSYGASVRAEDLCATPGASLSLQHLLTMFTRPTSTTRFAFFQDPTYHLAYKVFSDVGFQNDQFVPIPDDKDGLDTDHLEAFLKNHMNGCGNNSSNKNSDEYYYYTAVLYCVPTHANPSSTIMSAERREKLVRLAREYNILVICDDVYDLLTYDDTIVIPKRLVAYDLDTMGPDQKRPVVVSNGSFSKILSPGMRAGWIEAHPALIKRFGECGSFFSGGSPSNFANGVIAPMLDETADPQQLSLEGNIVSLRQKLRERRDLLQAAFEDLLVPLRCRTVTFPSGGYFMWLQLPQGVDRPLLQKIMTSQPAEKQLVIGWGNFFGVPDTENRDQHRFADHIRLCFAHLPVDQLIMGVQHLAELISLAQNSISKFE